MRENLLSASVRELNARLHARTLSPVDLVRCSLERIEAWNEAVNAFCLVDGERALAKARESEARWSAGEPLSMLDGLPCGVKDVTSTLDWAARRGSKVIPAGRPPSIEAPMVARLREAGAIFVGATNTAEFGWKGITDNPLYGICRNPWNVKLTPGGSSGGSAAALVLGMVAIATGSDAAGSIRIPASFCNLFGVKPSYGLVPTSPLSSYGTLSHQGAMGKTVADSAILLDVISRADPRGAPSVPYPNRDFAGALDGGVRGLRIAFSPNFGHVAVDGHVAELVAAAAARFESMGAEVEEVGEIFPEPRHLIDVLWKAALNHILKAYSPDEQRQIDPDLVAFAKETPEVSLDDYLAAAAQRAELGQQMQRFHARYDLLLTPTLPVQPFAAGAAVADPTTQKHWFDWAPFSYPFNLTMQPAASIPVGLTAAGLPVGAQLVGALYNDALVLRASQAYEAAYPPAMMPEEPRLAL